LFLSVTQPSAATVQSVAVCVDTNLSTLGPVADASVDNALLQTIPDLNKSLLEFIDIVDQRLMQTLLWYLTLWISSSMAVQTSRLLTTQLTRNEVRSSEQLDHVARLCAVSLEDNTVCHPQHLQTQ